MFLLQISQNVDGFRQNNSQGFLELIKLYKQDLLEIFFYFQYLPKLYFGFKKLSWDGLLHEGVLWPWHTFMLIFLIPWKMKKTVLSMADILPLDLLLKRLGNQSLINIIFSSSCLVALESLKARKNIWLVLNESQKLNLAKHCVLCKICSIHPPESLEDKV